MNPLRELIREIMRNKTKERKVTIKKKMRETARERKANIEKNKAR